jgi:hypothetical protein
MANRYDVMTGRQYIDRDGNSKTAWTRIGTLFPLRDKDGFSIQFDALPVPTLNDGKLEMRAVCFPPQDRDDASASRQQPQRGAASRPQTRVDLDDEVPF